MIQAPTARERRNAPLYGLARNPAAPLWLRRRIMGLPGAPGLMVVLRDRVPDDLAMALLELGDPGVALLLDDEKRTSPEVRRTLASHPDPAIRDARLNRIREDVANGRYVPLSDLERLTGLSGPAAWHALARDPDPRRRAALARSWREAPDAIWRGLLTDPEPAVRGAAAGGSRRLPPDLLPQLVADPATRGEAAAQIVLTPTLAAELAADPERGVRHAVARNPSLPAPARERMVTLPDPDIRVGLVLNPATPEPLRARLDAEMAARTRSFDDADIDALLAVQALWHDPVSWLREMPLAARLAYLNSPCTFLRRALASHPDLPPDAVSRLRQDQNVHVRWAAARRRDAPADYLEAVLRDDGDEPGRERLVEHPNFPGDAFLRFAGSAQLRLRAIACESPVLPTDLVQRLSRDPEPQVRRAAASHAKLPAEDAVRLLGEDDLDVVRAAAAAPALPIPVMVELVERAGL
jgi:hypothetical protein